MAENNNTFGAAGTSLNDLLYGSLNVSPEQLNQAKEFVTSLQPQPEPVDKNLAMLLYFSKMAEEASKPGATLLGSAATALQSPTAYLLQKREEERKASQPAIGDVLQVATLMAKPKGIKPGAGTNYASRQPLYISKDDGTFFSQIPIGKNENDLITIKAGTPISLNPTQFQNLSKQFPGMLFKYEKESQGSLQDIYLKNPVYRNPKTNELTTDEKNELGQENTLIYSANTLQKLTPDEVSQLKVFPGIFAEKPPTDAKQKLTGKTYVVTKEAIDKRATDPFGSTETPRLLKLNETIILTDADRIKFQKQYGGGSLKEVRQIVDSEPLGFASYQSLETIDDYLKSFGVDQNHPSYDYLKETLVDSKKAGEYYEKDNRPYSLKPTYQDGKILRLDLIPGEVDPIFLAEQKAKIQQNQDTIKLVNKQLLEEGASLRNNLARMGGIEITLNNLINGKMTTGRFQELALPIKQVFADILKLNPEGMTEQELLQSLSFGLAPLMRGVGSGSTSDMEFKAYQQAIVSLGNTPKANYLTLYTFKKSMENRKKILSLALKDIENGKSWIQVQKNMVNNSAKFTIYRNFSREASMDKKIQDMGFNKWSETLKKGEILINPNNDLLVIGGEKLDD